jgi:hypothetical protein
VAELPEPLPHAVSVRHSGTATRIDLRIGRHLIVAPSRRGPLTPPTCLVVTPEPGR